MKTSRILPEGVGGGRDGIRYEGVEVARRMGEEKEGGGGRGGRWGRKRREVGGGRGGKATYQSGMALAHPGCFPSRTLTCGMPLGTSVHHHQSDRCVGSGWEASTSACLCVKGSKNGQ